MKAIGPGFAEELQAAGLLGLPFSWGSDGDIQFGSTMTIAQIDAVNAVYAAHDPLKSAAFIKQPTLDDVVSVLKQRDPAFAVALDAKVSEDKIK